MKKQKLSVCLVVKNEARYLAGCLESIKNAADEIIVVDTGSTDHTVDIARRYTDKVFFFEWCDDFSKARNFSLDQATGNWILILDGDEELAPDSIQTLKKKMAQKDAEGYMIKVVNYYDAGPEILTSDDIVFRLFRNKRTYRYTGIIHEQICDNIRAINPNANIEISEDITLIHYGYMISEITGKNKVERNMRLLEEAVKQNPDSILDRHHYGVECFRSNRLENALEQFLWVYDRVDPQSVYVPKLLRLIASCKYGLGQREEALNFIEEVWQKHLPDHGDLYYLKAVICREQNRWAEAYIALQKCLAVPPQPAFYANVFCQHKTKVYQELGTLAEHFMDLETALDCYIKTLRENPRLVDVLGKIVAILNPRDNPDYTMDALNTVFDLSDPGIQLDLGHIFFREGAYPLAVKCFDAVTPHPSQARQVQLLKGLALLRIKEYPRALREISLLQPGDDFYITGQSNLFLYYWLNSQSEEAGRCLEKAKAAGASVPLVETFTMLLATGAARAAAINSDRQELCPIFNEIFERTIEAEAFTKLDEVLKYYSTIFSDHPGRLLAGLFYKYKLYDRAEAEYRKLLFTEHDGSTADLHHCLGKSCQAQGKLVEAEIYMRRAWQAGNKSPRAAMEIARLYQDLAIKALETGLENYPGHIKICDALEKIRASLIEV